MVLGYLNSILLFPPGVGCTPTEVSPVTMVLPVVYVPVRGVFVAIEKAAEFCLPLPSHRDRRDIGFHCHLLFRRSADVVIFDVLRGPCSADTEAQ